MSDDRYIWASAHETLIICNNVCHVFSFVGDIPFIGCHRFWCVCHRLCVVFTSMPSNRFGIHYNVHTHTHAHIIGEYSESGCLFLCVSIQSSREPIGCVNAHFNCGFCFTIDSWGSFDGFILEWKKKWKYAIRCVDRIKSYAKPIAKSKQNRKLELNHINSVYILFVWCWKNKNSNCKENNGILSK